MATDSIQDQCEHLPTARQRQICRGESGLPQATVDAYRRRWNRTATKTSEPPMPFIVAKPPPRVNAKPGDCLGEVLANLGFQTAPGCGCNDRKAQMNVWGIDGCRANMETIVAWLREQGESATWFSKANAAVNAATHGYFINPADPYTSIVEISLQLAERRQAATGE